MTKILTRDYTKCHGCRECETSCATISEFRTESSKPRVKTITWDLEGWGVSISCQHCQDPPCMNVCPKVAIYRDEEFNRVMVDYEKCIGCKMCMAACPFGAMDFDAELKRIIKCDLCDGDPMCAKLCAYGAISYVDENDECVIKTLEVAEKLKGMVTGWQTQQLSQSDKKL